MEPESGASIDAHFLRDRKVCATGRFLSMTQAEFADLVSSCGGRFLRRPARGTSLLVIGDDGWPARRDGSPTHVFQRARKLRALGYPIRFLSEEEFLSELGLTENLAAVRGLHTVADLTRILDISALQVRRWVRLGLLQPGHTVHRLSYFDFRQVCCARTLCQLIADGATLVQIREGLERLREWLPRRELPLAAVDMLQHDGRLLARFRGTLVEPGGQRHFDFQSSDPPPSDSISLPDNRDDVDALFDQALTLEDGERFDEAAEVYRRLILLEDADPALHFNLGNVLFQIRQWPEAAKSYCRALQLDPRYAEAWNNLGNVYAELQQWTDAVDAFHEALHLVPDYHEAQTNLAHTLSQMHTLRPPDPQQRADPDITRLSIYK